jgi:hypothetical protein
MEIRQPSQATLDKYGLSIELWLAIWEGQGRKCPICNKEPKTGTPVEFNVDHKHTPKWKKMLPMERRLYVRGIVCQWDNRSFLAKGMTLVKARNMLKYLEQFEGST